MKEYLVNRRSYQIWTFHFTYRILNKAGEIVWVEEFGDAVINNGKITYIEGIMLDITKEEWRKMP
jgi:PAS domain S-box-containing protein